MRRIIQKYQEGGVVQPAPGPAVATGIPQGGHAAAAIQSYLSGQAAGPLSYTAGQSTVPDYRALAAIEKKRRLAEQAAGTTGASAVVDGNTEHSDMMSGSQDFTTKDVTAAYEDLVSNNDPNVISSFEAGSGAADHSAFMSNANQNYADNVLNNTNYTPAQIAALNPAYNAGLAEANQTGLVDSVTNLLREDSSNGAGTLAEAGIRNVGGSFAQDGDNYGLPMEYMVVNSSDGSSQVFGPNNTVFDSIVDASVHSGVNNSGASNANAGDVFSPGATFAGGGTDNQGNFGIIGDIGGGLAEALGIVPEGYDWGANELDGLAGFGKAGVTQDAAATGKVGGVLSNLNLTGPVVTPTVTLDTSGGTQTANGLTFNNTYTGGYVDQNIGSGGKAQQRAEQAAQRIKNAEKAAGIALYGSEQAWLNATGGGNNMGGPIGPRVQTYNNGSPGGVSVAKSGLREDEIRQRQLMQARMPQAEASPLSDIGSKLAMGAVDKGIGSAASSMAAKEGFVGTLGTALGGNAATGAATGAAGTGLMAALGPIGIGIGLGKLFGLFNDGGKVPCSCGKTSCKCAKEMKSPLSGE